MKLIRTLVAGLLCANHLGAEDVNAMHGAIPAEKGSVDASGKFIPNKPEPGKETPEARELAEAKLRESMQILPDGPNCYRIGEISFNRARREVTIPATVNMDSGGVEYALVSETGKLHEALFSTKANPREIHLACLLLGLPKEDPAKDGSADCDVKVNVSWDTNGPTVLHELANLVVTSDTPEASADAKSLAGGPWRYVSSQMGPGGFAAAAEGSVISLIGDPAALMINQRDDACRDDRHVANRSLMPPKGSPVRIILTLPPPAANP